MRLQSTMLVLASASLFAMTSCEKPCTECVDVTGRFTVKKEGCQSASFDITVSQSGSRIEILGWGDSARSGTLMSDWTITFDPFRWYEIEWTLRGQFSPGQPPTFSGTEERIRYDDATGDIADSCTATITW